MDVQRKRLDRSLRAAVVWQAIADAPAPVDIKQICELTDMKRTPYLGELLEWLWAHGYIAREFEVRANGYAATVHWAIKAPDWQLDPLAGME